MAKNWFPKIDYKKCSGCLSCFNFCPHGVYTVEREKPKVKNPDECIEFCHGCEKICPQKAIKYMREKHKK